MHRVSSRVGRATWMGTLAWDAGFGKWAAAIGGDCLARMSGSCGRYQHFGVSCVDGRLGRGARRRGRWIGRSCLGRRGRLYVLLQRLVCPAVVEVSKPLRRDKSGLECIIRSIDGPTRARHRTAGSRQTCGTVVAAAAPSHNISEPHNL